jgi:hypothetical protein
MIGGATFPSTTQAPWVSLTVTDKKGKDVYKKADFELASEFECAGYTNHSRPLPEIIRWSQVDVVRVTMGGANPDKSCGGGGPLTIDLTKAQKYIDFVEKNAKKVTQ